MKRRDFDRQQQLAIQAQEQGNEKRLILIENLWGRDATQDSKAIKQHDEALMVQRILDGMTCGVIPSSFKQVGAFNPSRNINPAPILDNARQRGIIPVRTDTGWDYYQIN